MKPIYGVHYLKSPNIGDKLASPLQYLTIPGRVTRMVEFGEWNGDLGDVIIGGGGLLFLETEPRWRRWAELEKHKRIVWGVGTNYAFRKECVHPDFLQRFDLVGLRDAGSALVVPCASCLHPEFDVPRPEHTVPVVAYHHAGSLMQACADIPSMTNAMAAEDMWKVLDFLASGKVIITNSYHGCYWGSLLGRKVICYEARHSRFYHTPWPVLHCTALDWRGKVAEAESSSSETCWLEWARSRNLLLFENCKALLAA